MPSGRYRDWLAPYLAMDYGSSAPAVVYLAAQVTCGLPLPEGGFLPRGSILLLDEIASNVPGEPNKGLGWPIPMLADAILELAAAWKVRAAGCADDACFAQAGHAAGSIADEFQRHRVHFMRARKGGRIWGWEVMRRLMADAGKPDVPGLYVSRRCKYFWDTVPTLARDPKRVEDLATDGPDHAADAARYACVWQRPAVRILKSNL